LGADFAIHSSLLIAISWLTPFFILKKLRPSLEKCALRGISKGLAQALNEIDLSVADVIKLVTAQHSVQKALISEIIVQCSAIEPTQPSSMTSQSPLKRMLIDSSSLPAGSFDAVSDQ
jgi:hypothetical protein